jgi:hypothetical protein
MFFKRELSGRHVRVLCVPLAVLPVHLTSRSTREGIFDNRSTPLSVIFLQPARRRYLRAGSPYKNLPHSSVISVQLPTSSLSSERRFTNCPIPSSVILQLLSCKSLSLVILDRAVAPLFVTLRQVDSRSAWREPILDKTCTPSSVMLLLIYTYSSLYLSISIYAYIQT